MHLLADSADFLHQLLALAVLLPLSSFFLILCFPEWMGKAGKNGAFIATGAIGGAAVLSFICLAIWLMNHWPAASSHGDGHEVAHGAAEHGVAEHGAAAHGNDAHGDDAHGDDAHGDDAHGDAEHGDSHAHAAPHYTGNYYRLGRFGKLDLSISYYIDSLTVCMFCMVCFIATLIHVYAMGYMHDELHDFEDHEVSLADGDHLVRPGRYHRFFQYLSLFCFSMLGLVLAGNVAMVFVFWELVGICSYFLIGFYRERHSASTAANKAFIVNRVGDFGMIIGLMALWSSLGTFAFGNIDEDPEKPVILPAQLAAEIKANETLSAEARKSLDEQGIALPSFVVIRQGSAPDEWLLGEPNAHHQWVVVKEGEELRVKRRTLGIFNQVRREENDRKLEVPDSMVLADAPLNEILGDHASLASENPRLALANSRAEATSPGKIDQWRQQGYGYWLLVVAGVGIFCGCVGKSAQFPLHVWLPDAMEGPTPVSALVHSATMVAAGVYLVGRFFPVFAPEVLLVIASAGCITLFMAATIAITATDIKRVLAYSTVSQLGYMMLALGVGGWLAGLMHLITHAFFKSLLFMCSGSVIHAVHTNEMPEMGGLWKKMPVTAFTMLIGCLAIAGVSVPFVVGFSGYYSKDLILEQAYTLATYEGNNSFLAWVFFAAAAGGAAITAFYMFRMWYMTFAGKPRNQERYDHAHESPLTMYAPLIILSVFAVTVAWGGREGSMRWVELLTGTGIAGAISAWLLLRQRSASDSGEDHHHDTADDHHHANPEWWIWTPAILTGVVFVLGLLWQVPALHSVSLSGLLEQSRPVPLADVQGQWTSLIWPDEHFAHKPANHAKIVIPVTLLATATALAGIGLATVMYCLGWLNPQDVRRSFQSVHTFLLNKWWFDELYQLIWVRPSLWIGRLIARFDKTFIDWVVDGSARVARSFSQFWNYWADQFAVDGLINLIASRTHAIGLALRGVQTGRLRQYVMFIVLGTTVVFILVSFWKSAFAG